jgi:hypothetical protein
VRVLRLVPVVRGKNSTRMNKVPLPWKGTSLSSQITEFILDSPENVLCDCVYERFSQIMAHIAHIFRILKFVTLLQVSNISHPLVGHRFSCRIVRPFYVWLVR